MRVLSRFRGPARRGAALLLTVSRGMAKFDVGSGLAVPGVCLWCSRCFQPSRG